MKKWFKSALAVLLSGVMMIPSGIGVLAGNTGYTTDNAIVYDSNTEETGTQRNAFIADDRPVDRIYDTAQADNIVRATALESSYVPDGIMTDAYPAVRNQNPYGTCWAFAVTGLAELSVLKNEGKLVDLSELHSAYFAYHYTSDDGKDGVRYSSIASTNYLMMGGDPSFIYHSYANWIGVADEATVSYSGASTTLVTGLVNGIAMKDSVHLRNFYIVNKADTQYIKSLIKEYGGVGISYYDDNMYYDSATNSYYSSVSDNTNHAVMVVGWDDNKETTSANKGAWLIRNSWGSNNYSHYGYFWMSYDEPSIYKRVYAVDCVTDTDSSDDEFYDHNYQYDLSAYPQYGSPTGAAELSMANIYTATGTQLLKAVGVETQNANLNYTVKIYTDLTSASDPESGTLVRTQTGSFVYQGFYTVKLDDPLLLKEGQTFSVVIELEAQDGKSTVYYVAESSYSLGANVSWYCGADEGQSFVYSYYYKWLDMGKNYDCNLRIKAYTDDTEEPEPEVPTAPTGLMVSNTAASLTVKWETISAATSYEVYRAQADGAYSKIATVTDTSYIDTDVQYDTEYSYKIKAVNSDGASDYSLSCTLKKTRILVNNLKADTDGTKVQLSWNRRVAGADGYVIYRRTSDGDYTEIARTTETSYTDTTAKAGTYYYYAVALYLGELTEDMCDEVGTGSLDIPSVTGASNTTAGVQVKWTAVTGATGYIVYRKSGTGSWGRIADIKSGTTVSYTDKTAASGTTYTYTVRAYNADMMSNWNSTKSVKRLSDPSVTGASNVTAGVQVKWTAVTGATGYIVYRKSGTGSWGRIADIKSGSTVSYTDQTAVSGTTYTYTVRAYSGSTMGSWSSTKSVKRLSNTTVTSASNVTAGVQVKWTKVTGATGYIVYRKSGTGSYARIADIKSGSTISYTDKTAVSGTTYTYTVRAYNAATMSSYNSTKSVKRLSDPKLTSAAKVTSGINVKWGKVTGATGYIVYRKTAGGSFARIADIKSGSTVSYIDKTAKAGTTYTYTVRAYNGSTMSAWSSTKTAKR